jgi:hypothetical protein
LQHWLKMQKRNKRPLVLKDDSDETHTNPTAASKEVSMYINCDVEGYCHNLHCNLLGYSKGCWIVMCALGYMGVCFHGI